jgi:dipeptidyl aminopeptidase/acylaminoacyl peptidase
VLLPDPALSTGNGAKMIRRGWGQWGGAPYDDLMAVTDAALERPDLDASRTAAMGGSYGGYMANWIAGHTERFSAIVSHASLWSLEQFQGTTDYPAMWADEWGYPDTNPELYRTWSPDSYADAITTPMLVTHGDHDYRCPVGESLRLWSDLIRRGVDARLLWFRRREPLGPLARRRHRLVRDGHRVLERARARPGLGAPVDGLTPLAARLLVPAPCFGGGLAQ